MAHFGSVDWPTPYGRVAALEKTSVTIATGASSTEGTDQLTYTVARTGPYRVSALLRVRTAGTGASQATVARVTHNNGTAISAASIGMSGVTPGTLDATAAAGTAFNSAQVIHAVAGTNIVIGLNGSGTFTSAAVIDLDFVIEAI